MNKEELKQEAEKLYEDWFAHKLGAISIIGVICKMAEPREKRIEELEAQIEKMKCYLPVDERDSDHKWFAYKNLFDTKWKIDYSVQGELPKCNTIKWFENKEAVMFYLVSNGMKYYEEPRR